MKLKTLVSAAALTVLFTAGAALAQTAAPAPAATNARSAASLECSKEADAQNVHGKKVRKKFMRDCKKEKEAAPAAK